MDSEVEEESRKGKGAVFLQGEAIDNTNDQWKYRGARRIRLGLESVWSMDPPFGPLTGSLRERNHHEDQPM